MSRVIVALLLVGSSTLVYACSEATDGVVTHEDGGASSSDGGSQSGDDDGSTQSGGDDGGTQTHVQGDASVVLNEISASDEWVELVNSGSGAADVSGFVVADSTKDGGGPKLSDGVTLPAGTVLSPRAYLIVQGGPQDGGDVPCPDGGQSYCMHAKFGISNKSGETLYLVDATGAIVGEAKYPPSAAGSGETWGRVPNGDPAGAFQKTVPTPGAANVAK